MKVAEIKLERALHQEESERAARVQADQRATEAEVKHKSEMERRRTAESEAAQSVLVAETERDAAVAATKSAEGALRIVTEAKDQAQAEALKLREDGIARQAREEAERQQREETTSLLKRQLEAAVSEAERLRDENGALLDKLEHLHSDMLDRERTLAVTLQQAQAREKVATDERTKVLGAGVEEARKAAERWAAEAADRARAEAVEKARREIAERAAQEEAERRIRETTELQTREEQANARVKEVKEQLEQEAEQLRSNHEAERQHREDDRRRHEEKAEELSNEAARLRVEAEAHQAAATAAASSRIAAEELAATEAERRIAAAAAAAAAEVEERLRADHAVAMSQHFETSAVAQAEAEARIEAAAAEARALVEENQEKEVEIKKRQEAVDKATKQSWGVAADAAGVQLDRSVLFSWFRELDVDGDGTLSATELAKGWEREDVQAALGAAVSSADDDGDGIVDFDELMSHLDSDDSGHITVMEFLRGIGGMAKAKAAASHTPTKSTPGAAVAAAVEVDDGAMYNDIRNSLKKTSSQHVAAAVGAAGRRPSIVLDEEDVDTPTMVLLVGDDAPETQAPLTPSNDQRKERAQNQIAKLKALKAARKSSVPSEASFAGDEAVEEAPLSPVQATIAAREAASSSSDVNLTPAKAAPAVSPKPAAAPAEAADGGAPRLDYCAGLRVVGRKQLED